ncbi:hypothetical protein MMC22_004116 [Lobaria immixta]|nr:hypothetical protein [Lobaria immixta]
MDFLQMKKPFPFTQLPRELRNFVYEQVFFSGKNHDRLSDRVNLKFDSRKLKWASDGLAGTAKNQIHPYRVDSKHQPQYDVAILRTCHQIQEEAEAVLYGWSSFNLITDNFGPGEYQSYEFLQSLPRRCRRLIRRVEHRCYHEHLPEALTKGNRRIMTMFDWNAFMKFLAQECPSLQSLILWGFADGREGEQMLQSCHQDREWVQAIFQIKTLRFFDLPAIPRGKVRPGQSCVPEFLEQLRAVLYQKKVEVSSESEIDNKASTVTSSFPFLKLPGHIRDRVYRFALLPADKQLHPGIKPWYDGTTRNTLPLFLTCHQIHHEAEMVLYGQGTFCCVVKNSDLSRFFQRLPQRLRLKIRAVRVLNCSNFSVLGGMSKYLSANLDLDMLSFVVRDDLVSMLNRWWARSRVQVLREDTFLFSKGFAVEAPGCSVELDPALRDYFARRLENQQGSRRQEEPIPSI